MSTTTAIVRAAIAYVESGPPALLGERHRLLEETVRKYLARKAEQRTTTPRVGDGGELPETTTPAFAKGRGVRRLVRDRLRKSS